MNAKNSERGHLRKLMKEQNNLPVDINENNLFIQYLNDYEVPKKNIKIAEKIDFGGIYKLFDKNFDQLWDRIYSKKLKEDLSGSKKEFKENILLLLRQSIFNVLYIGIKNLKIKGIDYDELNNGILNDFEKIMKNFFRVFETEYELLIPSKKIKRDVELNLEKEKGKNDEGSSIKKIKIPKKVIEINYNPDEIPTYEKVLKEINETGKKEEGTSLRKIALGIAETELGIKNKDELQQFYKRFIKYKRKGLDELKR